MKKLLLPLIAFSLVGLSACGSNQSSGKQFSLTIKENEVCRVFRVTAEGNDLSYHSSATYTTGAVVSQYENYFTIKFDNKMNYFSNSVWGYYISIDA